MTAPAEARHPRLRRVEPVERDVEIVQWRGKDPQTGERDTDRWTIVHQGENVLSFGSEIECRQKVREFGWRVVEPEL